MRGSHSYNKVLSIILGACILGLLGFIVYLVISPQRGQPFTEFYILGPGGKAADYPTKLRVGDSGQVTAAIVSHEPSRSTYTVEIRLDGKLQSKEGPVSLDNGQTWEKVVSFTADSTGVKKVEFVLFRDGGSQPYVSPLYLWIDVSGRT